MDYETSPTYSEIPRKETSLTLFATEWTERRNAFSSRTSKVCFGVLVCLVCLCASILVNFSLLMKYGKLSHDIARQAQLIEKVIAHQGLTNPQHNTQIQDQTNILRRYKRKSPNSRNSRSRCGRRCRRRRHTNNRPNPVTHLTGQSNSTDVVYHGDYFIWQKPPLLFRTSFRYLGTGRAASVYGIEVLHSGIYVIYSQMAVHGFNMPVYKSDCAHETVRVRSGESQVLLRSVLTQDQRGRGFHNDGGDDEQYPLDSAMQMGIFALRTHDKIFIHRPEQCSHVNFQMDHRFTYFGAFMLHPIH